MSQLQDRMVRHIILSGKEKKDAEKIAQEIMEKKGYVRTGTQVLTELWKIRNALTPKERAYTRVATPWRSINQYKYVNGRWVLKASVKRNLTRNRWKIIKPPIR